MVSLVSPKVYANDELGSYDDFSDSSEGLGEEELDLTHSGTYIDRSMDLFERVRVAIENNYTLEFLDRVKYHPKLLVQPTKSLFNFSIEKLNVRATKFFFDLNVPYMNKFASIFIKQFLNQKDPMESNLICKYQHYIFKVVVQNREKLDPVDLYEEYLEYSHSILYKHQKNISEVLAPLAKKYKITRIIDESSVIILPRRHIRGDYYGSDKD